MARAVPRSKLRPSLRNPVFEPVCNSLRKPRHQISKPPYNKNPPGGRYFCLRDKSFGRPLTMKGNAV